MFSEAYLFLNNLIKNFANTIIKDFWILKNFTFNKKFVFNYEFKIKFTYLIEDLWWIKSRINYYLNNWVYTTNHKRIAMNYFWFIVFSGLCGMVLATIIRLEMAYPGPGILAGDSLQYLSVVTAHGVIMVFFMIMPLLFGAFSNFLLPTQMGVHDVAFPRLNSAAFWFLPAGLIMLCQLVCIDRRYYRINCFNFKEVESLLKQKYFFEITNNSIYNSSLNKTNLQLNYKLLNKTTLNHNIFNNHLVYPKLNNNLKTYNLTGSSNSNIIQHKFNMLDFYSYFVNYTINLLTYSYLYMLNASNVINVSNCYNLILNLNINLSYFKCDILNLLINTSLLANTLSLIKISVIKCLLYVYTLISLLKINSLFQITFENINYVTYYNDIINKIITILWSSFNYCYSLIIVLLKFNYYTVLNLIYNNTYFKINNWTNSTSFNIKLETIFSFDLFVNIKIISNLYTSFINYNLYWAEIIVNYFKLVLLSTYSTTLLFSTLANNYNNVGWSYFNNNNIYLNQFILNFSFVLNTLYYKQFIKLFTVRNEIITLKPSLNENSHVLENALNKRYHKNDNLIFKYDYKAGTYFNETYLINFNHMLNSTHHAFGGFKKAEWFNSDTLQEKFKNYFVNSYSNLLTLNSNKYYYYNKNMLSYFDIFFYIWYTNYNNNLNLNNYWINFKNLETKFVSLFLTQTLQQRIINNWRSFKFTRESWRCRLLIARHQKTLYRRYTHEDNLFWSIERNAKDLLPGWAMITPFSARTRFTVIGKTDIGLMAVLLTITASIINSTNFLITYRYLSTLNNRKMRDARCFFTEGVIVASWMMIAANPMLILAIIMLLFDRHWRTSFFDYSGGGDTILFQHMFWFFGHPEVYIIIIPCFGFTNTILAYYLRKRISARASLIYSMYTIAVLGFFVWGHHMYMVGLAHTTRMLYSTLTVMISVPAATKLMHWMVTFVNSSIHTELPLYFILIFIFFFITGGISGMFVAHTGMDVLFHDTLYVVGHFHVMLAGSGMFASFGAFYFYFPALLGVKYSRIYAYLHFIYYLIGQLLTITPMLWLGYAGMPRRVLDYPVVMGGWHSIISGGHILSIGGTLAFFIVVYDSIYKGRAIFRNTLGVGRYNNRLNFYLYEIHRLHYLRTKQNALLRTYFLSNSNNNNNKINLELYETTLINYNFNKRV